MPIIGTKIQIHSEPLMKKPGPQALRDMFYFPCTKLCYKFKYGLQDYYL